MPISCVGRPKSELDTPALIVDLDIMERNIATIAGACRAAGVSWRPHFKGIKVPAISLKAIGAGAIGITCAKLGEAEVAAAAGIRDILIANQIVTQGTSPRQTDSSSPASWDGRRRPLGSQMPPRRNGS